MSDLTPKGIRLDVIDTSPRRRAGGGHPSWYLAPGGGEVDWNGYRIEVQPDVDMATEGHHSYEEIERLADRIEHEGGFMWVGDTMHVGDAIVTGRDTQALLVCLWKRAGKRAKDPSGTDYDRGYAAAVQDAKKAIAQVGS